MPWTVVDKFNGFEVRKLHSPKKDKTFGYQTAPIDYKGDNINLIAQHANLTAARIHLGMPAANTPKTAPKSAYAQNGKGYRATAPSAGKKQQRSK